MGNDNIGDRLKKVYELINECEEIAKRTGESFDLDVAHGMGGTFFGDADDNYQDGRVGWVASSHTC